MFGEIRPSFKSKGKPGVMDRHPEAPLINRRHVLETVAAFLTDLVDNDKIKEDQLYTIFDQLKDPEKQLWLAENFSIQHQR